MRIYSSVFLRSNARRPLKLRVMFADGKECDFVLAANCWHPIEFKKIYKIKRYGVTWVDVEKVVKGTQIISSRKLVKKTKYIREYEIS